MTLPRILIIDDLFGGSLRDRKNFCKNFALVDMTGDEKKPLPISEAIAEAIFESSQVKHGKAIDNVVDKALEAVATGWGAATEKRWALVLLDLRFVSGQIDEDGELEGTPGDDLFGLKVLDAIHCQHPDLPVVIISSKERSSVIEDCRRRGAADFIQRHDHSTTAKPPKEILAEKLIEHGLLEDTREGERVVGKSLPILKTLRAARRTATGKGNILLLGETGVGKELFAKYVHAMSPKAKGPFKVLNPGGMEESLQADELFGHVKGAFTDAREDKGGLFELANGGTLFIDEIGDVSHSLQLKLLRPLENFTVKRQGGVKDISIDLQVVLATNKDLDQYARTQKFKNDLLNRIKTYPITIPPLRERTEDIPLIAEHLLEGICQKHNARWPRKFLPEAIVKLLSHDWPDNVRELRNVLERAVLNNKDSELVIPQDISFGPVSREVPLVGKKQAFEDETESITQLINSLQSFQFPKSYDKLQGKLPALQEAVTMMFANYLSATIEVTRKNRPGSNGGSGINITGAASCMKGEQLRTTQARDVIKRLLHFEKNNAILEQVVKENALLQDVYQEVKKRGKNGE